MIVLGSIASETGARFVDLQFALAERADDRARLFIDEMHLSVEGNRFVAQELLPAVRALAGCGDRPGSGAGSSTRGR